MKSIRIIAVDSVIIKDKKVLLIQRKFSPYQGFWALPGGLVKKNETLRQAVIRETKEETGLKAKPLKIIGIYDSPTRDPRGIVSIAFLCKPLSSKIKPGAEVLSARFFSFKDVRKMKLAMDHNIILKDALTGLE